MSVETAAYLANLNPSQPQNDDLIKEGDDHIRLLKSTLLNTIPNFDSAISISSAEMNAFYNNTSLAESGITFTKTVIFSADQDIVMSAGSVSGVRDAVNGDQVMPKSQIDTVLDEQTAEVEALIQEVEARISTISSLIYPVGSIYYTKDANFDPASYFGVGTWVKIEGRIIVGVGTLDDGATSKSFATGEIGGEFLHLLTPSEMPKHSHTASRVFVSGGGAGYDSGPGHTPTTITTTTAGNDAPHNNMQPYVAAVIWERIT